MAKCARSCEFACSIDLNLPGDVGVTNPLDRESSPGTAHSENNNVPPKRRRCTKSPDGNFSEDCLSTVGDKVKSNDDVLRIRSLFRDKPASVICRVEDLGKLIRFFDDRKRGWIIEMGFGGLLHLVNMKLPRDLCYWLMTRVDPLNERLTVGGVVFRLTSNQVRWVLGLPKGENPVPSYFLSDESYAKLVELENKYGHVWKRGEGRGGKIVTRKGFSVSHGVLDRLMAKFEADEAYEFKTLFLMAALHMVLCPTQCSRFPKELLPAVSCAVDAKMFDWCGLVLKKLMASAQRFANRFESAGYVGGVAGCTLFLALFYLDHLKRNPVQWLTRPRIKVWTNIQIRLACEADRPTADGDFGAVGVLDIAYGENHPYDARDAECPSDVDEFDTY